MDPKYLIFYVLAVVLILTYFFSAKRNKPGAICVLLSTCAGTFVGWVYVTIANYLHPDALVLIAYITVAIYSLIGSLIIWPVAAGIKWLFGRQKNLG